MYYNIVLKYIMYYKYRFGRIILQYNTNIILQIFSFIGMYLKNLSVKALQPIVLEHLSPSHLSRHLRHGQTWHLQSQILNGG